MAGVGTAHLREGETLLTVSDLAVEYHAAGRARVQAVSQLSFDLRSGETLGIVGESGCGKSSVARAIVQLPPPTSGTVTLDGADLTRLQGTPLRRVRRHLQLVLQDSVEALNPRRTVRGLVGEGLRLWRLLPRAEHASAVDGVLRAVGLDPDVVGGRRRSQLSGGQCQRVTLARALLLDPSVLICDEAVSALDVSAQAQILNLLHDMKARYGLALIFITHDLSVVKNVSDRVMVMYLGRFCEVASADALVRRPAHPYTRLLLESLPESTVPGEEILAEVSEPPSSTDPPSGCRFRTECPRAAGRCATEVPHVREVEPDHYVACHFPEFDTSRPALQLVAQGAR
jgi:peptide/nickel transport system ATP-binding protein